MRSSGPLASRIIPAYAGSTFSARVLSSRATDHPRIRGEHVHGQETGLQGDGSSPHTRGARSDAAVRRGVLRIIPAYAGSTGGTGMTDGANNGSSPHTRGAPAV